MITTDNQLNLIITLHPLNSEEGVEIYLPEVPTKEFDSLSNMLGTTYTLIKDGDINPDVFVVDWNSKLQEAMKDSYEKDLKKFTAFYERLLLTAKLYNKEENKFYSLLQDREELNNRNLFDSFVENDFKGLLLFIFALWRYTRGESRMSVLGLFITPLTLSEWEDLHKRYSPEQNSQDINPLKVEII